MKTASTKTATDKRKLLFLLRDALNTSRNFITVYLTLTKLVYVKCILSASLCRHQRLISALTDKLKLNNCWPTAASSQAVSQAKRLITPNLLECEKTKKDQNQEKIKSVFNHHTSAFLYCCYTEVLLCQCCIFHSHAYFHLPHP